MTVSTTSNRISYNGDNTTTVFSFPYKFLDVADIKVFVGGVLQTITTDYSVGTPSDTGANITFVSAPAVGTGNVVFVRESDLLQQAALKSNGKFPAETVEDMIDKLTLIVQRLEDKFNQSLVVPDDENLTAELPDKATRAGKYLSFDSVTGDPEVVNAVLDVTTVAGIASDITTVSGIAGNVTTVAGIAADVTTVAGISADVTAVANNAANINAVAAITAEVIAVAAIDTEIVIAANNVADITNFADVYQGGKNADPALRNDGSALQAGDLYFNTVLNSIKYYTGTVWLNINQLADGDKGDITVSASGATWTIDNDAVTTAKILDANVTTAKASATFLNGFSTVAPALSDFIPFSDITNSNANAKATAEDVVKAATNASGSAPIYACRAWVNFNGTGTVAIRASGNVSSITDNGTGNYDINFTTAIQDTNYMVSVNTSDDATAQTFAYVANTWASSGLLGSIEVTTANASVPVDRSYVGVAIFR